MKSIIYKILKKQIQFRVDQQVNAELENRVTESLQTYGFIPITETQPQDVFIVGYPKSGNTWMQFMMSSLLNQIDPGFLNLSLVLEFVPDVHYKKFYKRYRDVCYFKSHHYPRPEYKKVIYLVRDGRDAMVSYYHMNKVQFTNYSMEEMIKEGKGLFPGKWHDHVKQWLENPYGADILFVKYEDMKADAVKELKRVCDFLSLTFSDEQIRKVVEGCSFDKLKKLENTIGLNDGNRAWRGDKGENFFRKGLTGGYHSEISETLIKHFENESREQLIKLKYL